jgi:alkylhydroperoxidase family enzyme
MPRITPLDAPYAPEIQASFDAIMQGAPPLLLFRTLAVSARAWKKFRAGSLLDRGPLNLRARELVINRTCALNGCEYEWGVHVAIFADAANLTPNEVVATAGEGSKASGWPEADRVILETVEALHTRSTLSDTEFTALRTHLEVDEIFEVFLLSGFYRTVAYLANGLALPLEETAARFPA